MQGGTTADYRSYKEVISESENTDVDPDQFDVSENPVRFLDTENLEMALSIIDGIRYERRARAWYQTEIALGRNDGQPRPAMLQDIQVQISEINDRQAAEVRQGLVWANASGFEAAVGRVSDADDTGDWLSAYYREYPIRTHTSTTGDEQEEIDESEDPSTDDTDSSASADAGGQHGSSDEVQQTADELEDYVSDHAGSDPADISTDDGQAASTDGGSDRGEAEAAAIAGGHDSGWSGETVDDDEDESAYLREGQSGKGPDEEDHVNQDLLGGWGEE
jgi:hypothetical protein